MNAVVQKIWREMDETWRQIRQRQARKGEPLVISCGRGCFACCREPVWVMEVEADAMIAAIPSEELEGVKARLVEWLARVEPSGLLAEEPNVMAWRALKAWCPLLKNGECLVYHNRPMGCRTHNATGPREACHDDDKRPRQIFVMIVEFCDHFQAKLAHANAGKLAGNLGAFLAQKLLGRYPDADMGVGGFA